MITAQIEMIQPCLPELLKLWPEHWRELALYQDRMPLRPNIREYILRNVAGTMFLATLRWDSRLVGYYVCQVATGLHYSETLTGTLDIVWILPEVRDRGLAFPLFRVVKKELQRRGVKLWSSGYKTDNPLGMDKLLPLLGFTPSDSYMSRWLDDRKQGAQVLRPD